jgi:hypothetical protein
MGRQIIIGLAGLLVVLIAIVAVTAGGDLFKGFGKHDAPTIMVISSDLLQQTVAVNERRSRADDEKAAAAALAKTSPSPTPGAKPDKGAGKEAAVKADDKQANDKRAEDNRTAAQAQADNMQTVTRAMEDSLGGKVAQDIENSHRFRLIAEAKVVDAMDVYARKSDLSPRTVIQSLMGRTSDSSNSGRAASSERADVLAHGIPEVAAKVHADYTLTITVGEPRFSVDELPPADGQPGRVVMVAQPIVNCEIFATKGSQAYRFSNQLAKPITETVVLDPDTPRVAQILVKLTRLNDRISEAASQQVLALILDRIAPARIVRADGTIVINRGANDGIKEGAIYAVQREVGDAMHETDSGADLGKLRTDVGSIVIQSAQPRLSTATAASGGPFLKDDIVLLALPKSPNGPTAGVAAAGPKPGGVPNVAVDHIRAVGSDREFDSPELGRLVSDALATDPRIAVLARAEMSSLRSEAAHNGAAGGDMGLSPEEGMRQSGYLVDGQCSGAVRDHANTISVGGVSRTVSTSASIRVTCTLRATAMDGRMIGSAEGGGDSAAAAASAAAKALLVKILPAMGVSAPAPVPAAAAAPVAPPSAPGRPEPHRAQHAKSAAPAAQPQESEVHF